MRGWSLMASFHSATDVYDIASERPLHSGPGLSRDMSALNLHSPCLRSFNLSLSLSLPSLTFRIARHIKHATSNTASTELAAFRKAASFILRDDDGTTMGRLQHPCCNPHAGP